MIYDKLIKIKNECEFLCVECQYARYNEQGKVCSLQTDNGEGDVITPHDWDDEFIRNLALIMDMEFLKREGRK